MFPKLPSTRRASLVSAVLAVSLVVRVTGASGESAADRRADRLTVRGTAWAGARPESNAVVWLETRNAVPGPAKPVVLTQRNLTFLPRVLAVTTGATVEFPNEDRVFHNVFSFHDGEPFDLGTYPVGGQKRVTFSRPGVSRLLCNIHPTMAAYVVTVSSPHVAAVAPDGSFAIDGVAAGTYTYRAWRPTGPELSGTWNVVSDGPAVSSFTVSWPR